VTLRARWAKSSLGGGQESKFAAEGYSAQAHWGVPEVREEQPAERQSEAERMGTGGGTIMPQETDERQQGESAGGGRPVERAGEWTAAEAKAARHAAEAEGARQAAKEAAHVKLTQVRQAAQARLAGVKVAKKTPLREVRQHAVGSGDSVPMEEAVEAEVKEAVEGVDPVEARVGGEVQQRAPGEQDTAGDGEDGDDTGDEGG
jgi:hypothetical protein